MAKNEWVDFRQLKEEVTILMVLEHYGIRSDFQEKGDRLTGACPIHEGSNPRQFTVTVSKNAWKCHSGHCGRGGNQIDFVAFMEGFYPEREKTEDGFRKAALLVAEWFGFEKGKKKTSVKRTKSAERKNPEEEPEKNKAASQEGEPVANKPLTFELKLDPRHPYLESRGLTRQTVEYFGLGFSNKGSMKGRIAIPIHNAGCELVAYAGRWVGEDSEIPKGEGKYKLPSGFHKGLEVYNLHREVGTKSVILVEGFASVWWLHQNGFENVVSCMGSSLSGEQAKLLADRFKGVEIFFDGDAAGVAGGEKVALELARKVWVRIVGCLEGLQPDRLPEHELRKLLA